MLANVHLVPVGQYGELLREIVLSSWIVLAGPRLVENNSWSPAGAIFMFSGSQREDYYSEYKMQ
jgi:hypothetical protein